MTTVTPTVFTLDTSGAVYLPIAGIAGTNKVAWSDLSPFAQGYIEALFASVAGAFDEGRVWRRPVAFRDLAPETLACIIADCEAFQKPAIGAADWIVFNRATGGDFWRDRQAHQLTAHSTRQFPPLTVTLGDDGKVRFA